MSSLELTCASFFAGVGGIDLGFEEQGFRTIYANEFDAKARETFTLNFPEVTLDSRDIREVSASDVPKVDVIMGGFLAKLSLLQAISKVSTMKKVEVIYFLN